MVLIVRTIGILILIIAIVFFVKPSLIRSFIDFAKVGKRVYIGGVVRLVIGGLLLISTPHVWVPWITGVIGTLIAITGILIFGLGVDRIHRFMDWLYVKPDNRLRIPPTVVAVVGVLLIYAA